MPFRLPRLFRRSKKPKFVPFTVVPEWQMARGLGPEKEARVVVLRGGRQEFVTVRNRTGRPLTPKEITGLLNRSHQAKVGTFRETDDPRIELEAGNLRLESDSHQSAYVFVITEKESGQ